jgi:hypothetical protein
MKGGIEVKKKCIYILSLFTLLFLSSCVQNVTPKVADENTQQIFYLGARPLPKEFLDYWFENLEDIKDGKINPIVFEGNVDSRLIVTSQQIAQTQTVIDAPEYSTLSSSYLARHTGPNDQFTGNTCWAFASVGSLESALLTQFTESERKNKYPFLNANDPDLSEQFIAYYNFDFDYANSNDHTEESLGITIQETNKDFGGNFFFATFNFLRRGVPYEWDFPYAAAYYPPRDWIEWTASDSDWKHHLVYPDKTGVIRSYDEFQNYQTYINTIKSAIVKYGALSVGFGVYHDFYDYWDREKNDGKVYQKGFGATKDGDHGVLLVGWVDNYKDPESSYEGPIWVLKNSWGSDDGFSLSDYGLSSGTTKGYFALPMLTENEFMGIFKPPDWKIETSCMYVPIFIIQNVIPTAPSKLKAEALSATEIKLTWQDNSDNEDGFKIERKVGTSGTWSQIKTVGANEEEYTDSRLNPNTTYYYRVRAYNSAGNSSYSNEDSATTYDVVPNAPSNLEAEALSSSQIKLTWRDNSTNETGFKIERKVGTSGTWSQIKTVGANEEEYTDSSELSPNTTYYYRVRAYNSVGNSSYSNEDDATTKPQHSDPRVVGHCDTEGHAWSVYVKDDYAYVADWKNGLVVIDVRDAKNPKQVSRIRTGVKTLDVYVENNYAYVIDEANGLHVVDISNPANPMVRGDFSGGLYSPQGVYVKDKYAYVTSWYGLVIVDISDPDDPEKVGSYDIGGGGSTGVYVKDKYAYMGDGDDLMIIDISDPDDPEKVGSCDTEDRVADVYVKDRYAYVVNNESGLVVVDVSNPKYPKEVGHCDTKDRAFGVYVRGGYAYVADEGNGLVVMDVSNSKKPKEVGQCDTEGEAYGVYVKDDYAYVADGENGLVIIDVSYF